MAETPQEQDRVCVGVVVGAHGIRGQVRVKSFTADPEHLDSYGPLADEAATRDFALEVVGRAKGVVICAIDGIDDRDAAERLKGTRLYLDRALLPPLEEDEFYHSDLIGLDAVFPDGEAVGTVAALYDFGAGDVMEIKGAAGGAVMIPFTRDSVPTVNLDDGFVVVERIPGLLEEPPKPGTSGARKRSGPKRRPAPRADGGADGDDDGEWPDEDWRDE